MPNEFPSPSPEHPFPQRRAAKIFLGIVAAILLLAAATWAIVSIMPIHASNDGPGCVVTGESLQAFDAASTPAPVPTDPIARADGSTHTLAAYEGRGVVLNFWATWCAPCVREMPELDRLNAVVKGDGIDVLTISQDRGGFPVIDTFFDTNNLANLERLHDPKGKLGRAFGIRGLPTTIFIDSRGRELGRLAGLAKYDTPEMIQFVRQCLKP